ncbi:MAG: DUF3604 domain-containing protein [Gammaproteobacteria bacterium]|nr:DUF3604 domain-containing protein [Gammaproteobacteria bacterium]MDE0365713.1 DUF3604 domain-containing protein [Gammaproteobacteria bacterium]
MTCRKPLLLLAWLLSGPTLASHPDELLWGDTHVHSRNSPDAYFLGNTQLSAEDAYRFAQGEPVHVNGSEYRLRRPLDFLVVTDHAEYMGVLPGIDELDPALMATELGRRWRRYVDSGDREPIFDEFVASLHTAEHRYPTSPAFQQSVWHRALRAADAANDAGRFTALIGFEWTSMPAGNNLHRNVVFADGFARVSQVPPYSQFDSDDPADLWRYMDDYERRTGGRVLAIPHNANLSNGIMFTTADFAGRAMTAEHAALRSRWEPVVEATQIKGDSEAHPLLSPDDAFADYETWDWSNIAGTEAKQPWMLKYEYARSALRIGIELDYLLGANPYDFGMIGSSDSHTSMAAVEEDNYLGKFIINLPSPTRIAGYMTGGAADTGRDANWRQSATGYAAVWARDNTRVEIFDALRRKEVYATTGSRIGLRFFGGWGYRAADLESADAFPQAYQRGVPMGGTLEIVSSDPASPTKTPTFLLWAWKDPEGVNLARAQIIKGWVDARGTSHERVFDVALAAEAGSAELSAYWQDEDFDSTKPAFYYARVIEVPSPRWTAYEAERYELTLREEIPTGTQERAYGSPIWIRPQ